MKIEEAIQSKGFENEAQRTQINILHTAAHLNLIHSITFKKFGVSAQQYNALRIINGQAPQPTSIQIINERMIDRASNGSRIVDKLVEKKLVNRKVCPKDRRQVDITITPKAKELIQHVHTDLIARFEDMNSIDPAQLEALNNTLDLIRKTTTNK